MKTPITIDCQNCGRQHIFFVSLDEDDIRESFCSCGEEIFGTLDGTISIGDRLLWRSEYEFSKNKDYSLCVVFAAAALDCELSRLYFKWSLIEGLENKVYIDDEELEEQLRKFSNIKTKIEKVVQLMAPEGVNQFVMNDSELRKLVENGFPTLDINNLSISFQKKLFWPRNRILHLGASDYGKKEATICFNIAQFGLMILERLDKEKRNC